MSIKDSKLPLLALLTFLAVVFTGALAFATIELPGVINRLLVRYFPDYHPAIEPEIIEEFLGTVRPIGYVFLAVVIVLIIVGFVIRKRSLSSLGAIFLFLPTFGYFAASMFFLAGLGILRVPWIPFGDPAINLVNLGDISYLPYMALVYPFSLAGVDVRMAIAWVAVGIGLFIFILGTITWFYGKVQKIETVDFWVYRYSRHPQYLGFIIWSYGVMLIAALEPVVRGGENPGASLPWLLASLIVICIALAEEINMSKRDSEGYSKYKASAPFMFSFPRFITSVITAPIRILFKKNQPETGKELIATFAVYSIILIVLSLPFVLLHWPPGLGWSDWPAYIPSIPEPPIHP